MHLNNDVPFKALSGTLPPHIKSFIVNNLLFKPSFKSVTYTSNCESEYEKKDPKVMEMKSGIELELSEGYRDLN